MVNLEDNDQNSFFFQRLSELSRIIVPNICEENARNIPCETQGRSSSKEQAEVPPMFLTASAKHLLVRLQDPNRRFDERPSMILQKILIFVLLLAV